MSNRQIDKDDVAEFEDSDDSEFEVDGLTYEFSLDDMLSAYEEEETEDEPWNRRNHHQVRDRLKHLGTISSRYDDFGDNWDEDDY